MSTAAGSATLGVADMDKLERILSRILQKDIMGPPKECARSDDVKTHLKKINEYIKTCGIDNQDAKVAILFNSLCEDMRDELCGLLEFSDHQNDFHWISKKLMELFQPRETQISSLMKLFACRQSEFQTTREFLAEIRRVGYKLLGDLPSKEREKHLLKAFINGLKNQEAKNALGQMSLSTLDEAFEMIKKEKTIETASPKKAMDLRVIKDHSDQTVSDIQKLQNQMGIIQKQLAHISSILDRSFGTAQKNETRPSYAAITQRYRPNQDAQLRRETRYPTSPRRVFERELRRPIECWECGQRGHIAKFCKTKSCQQCGQRGMMLQIVHETRVETFDTWKFLKMIG